MERLGALLDTTFPCMAVRTTVAVRPDGLYARGREELKAKSTLGELVANGIESLDVTKALANHYIV
jgi:hypothetical protein